MMMFSARLYQKREKRGILFTLDTIFAIGLTVGIFAFLGIYFSITPEFRYRSVYSSAEDGMQLLSKLTIADVQDKVQDLIDDGYILPEDYDKSVLGIIGTLWVGNNTTQAANLTRKILDNVTKCYELTIVENINESSIYKSCPSYGDSIAIASRLQSGIEKGKPVKGYIARSWATESRQNQSAVFPFHPQGAGNAQGAGNELNITKLFEVNASQILNSRMFATIHSGTSNLGSQSEFWVNGIDYLDAVHWDNNCPPSPTNCTGYRTCCLANATKGLSNIQYFKMDTSGDIRTGWNNVSFILIVQAGEETHLHPGTRIEVDYNSTEYVLIQDDVKRRFYFDNVISKSKSPPSQRGGVWSIMPLSVPVGSQVKNATLHIMALDALPDVSWRPAGQRDVMVYFNKDRIYAENMTGANTTHEFYLNLTAYLANNTDRTNVMTVYIDTFDDDFWAESTSDVTLFSSPRDTPANSSYVEIEYVNPPEIVKYGQLAINVVKPFGGIDWTNPTNRSFNFTDNDIYSSYLHITQLDNLNVTVNVTPAGQPSQQVFQSPTIRGTPQSIYIDPRFYNVTVNNTIHMMDPTCGLFCEFVNDTSLEYTIYVPGQVGYGGVFNNQSAANDDATTRLNDSMKQYADLITFAVDLTPTGVGGIPGLWGPAAFTLRVWE